MTLNAKIDVLWVFWRLWAARHISRTNCIDFTTDRSRHAAYEIFSTEHRFQQSKSRKPANENIKKWYPLKVVILLLLASLPWKRLQIGMDMLHVTTSPIDELFSHINIDDSEKSWTPKI